MQVEVEGSDKGALRLAREAGPDVLLCEELKHLYTALTRAKNNVVIFDSNTAKSAPFFNYLRRLGMAQYVSRSVNPPPFRCLLHAPQQLHMVQVHYQIVREAALSQIGRLSPLLHWAN